MPTTPFPGPDVVICGAARAGTTFLASLLSRHPAVDAGAVKESNFFSREFKRGTGWYDGLYQTRAEGLLRLDASTSYTSARFPEALGRLVELSPEAVVVYSVREPLGRLFSHFQLRRDYFRGESATALGDALTGSDVYRGASDYARWLGALQQLVRAERLLVVPFSVVTERTQEVIDVLCGMLGLDPAGISVLDAAAQQHRNEVVEFRHESIRRARKLVRRTGIYPWLRRRVGKDRLRGIRAQLTRNVASESLDDALGTCQRAQLLSLQRSYDSARVAVVESLAEQDRRLGLNWSAPWRLECPEGGHPALTRRLEVTS